MAVLPTCKQFVVAASFAGWIILQAVAYTHIDTLCPDSTLITLSPIIVVVAAVVIIAVPCCCCLFSAGVAAAIIATALVIVQTHLAMQHCTDDIRNGAIAAAVLWHIAIIVSLITLDKNINPH